MARPTQTMQTWARQVKKEIARLEVVKQTEQTAPEPEKEAEKVCAGCSSALVRMPWNEEWIYWVCDKDGCSMFRRPQVKEVREEMSKDKGLAHHR